MAYSERAFAFSCHDDEMIGIVAQSDMFHDVGVLIVVGGPQYRVGSHRQFLLLSRVLAEAGYPTMRFDIRGMGDSSGVKRDFESISDDIGSAIEAFVNHSQNVKRIVMWGLCDAASASLLYYYETRDSRVSGLVLLNPWVRSEATLARTHLKYYYLQRIWQADFWLKLLRGKFGFRLAVNGFLGNIEASRKKNSQSSYSKEQTFQEKMLQSVGQFSGPVLLLLSENDYTAKEFREMIQSNPNWELEIRKKNVSLFDIAEADHTFSSRVLRGRVEAITLEWLQASVK